MSELEYTQAHLHEGHGAGGSLGLKILVASPGYELTEEAKSLISYSGEQLYNALLMQRAKADPGNITARKEWVAALRGCFPENCHLFVEEIPNGYCSGPCCVHKPWLVVTTLAGRIAIGPRKRVIEISWEGTTVKKTAAELFPEEEVTKEGRLIHAWGLEKAKEYILRLLAPWEG